MIESYMGPTANFAGSNSERQSVGLPGHCVKCAEHGHVAAHPDLGCGDVGCNAAHDEPAPLIDEPSEPAAPAGPVQEPRLWSVLVDTGGCIWLRIGEDADGVGIWSDTGQSGPRYSRYTDLSVDCVLALGLAQPLRPQPSHQ